MAGRFAPIAIISAPKATPEIKTKPSLLPPVWRA